MSRKETFRTRRPGIDLAAALLCVLWSPWAAWGRRGPTPVLNPEVYRSASKAYSLVVNPTDLYGRGAATHRLEKKGKELIYTIRYTYYLLLFSSSTE